MIMKLIKRCNIKEPSVSVNENFNHVQSNKTLSDLEMGGTVYTIGHSSKGYMNNDANLPPPTYDEAIYNLQQRSARANVI